MMANVKTTGVAIGYKAADGTTFSSTISGLDAGKVSDADDAKELATRVAKIVDGTVASVKFIETTNVDLEA